MSKDKATDGAETPKKGKKKLLLLVVAVLLLAGGGAGGYFMFAGGKSGEEKKPAPEPGAVVALEAITVNLADGHYLKIRIALQATADVSEELDGSKALDIVISEFSNRSVAELSSNGAREEAKKKLTEKVSKAYKEEVMAVYFTEFVMQ
jgi:flagellar FliL protein